MRPPLELVFYCVALIALVKPLGWYMARVLGHRPFGLDRWLGPVERGTLRLAGARAHSVSTSALESQRLLTG